MPEVEQMQSGQNSILGKCHVKVSSLFLWISLVLMRYRVNVKLDGINAVLDGSPIHDPANPTVVMGKQVIFDLILLAKIWGIIGADVMHPAPGAEGRPSFTTVVSSIDSLAAKYIALSRVQTGRQELIDDLEEMCTVRFHFTIQVDRLSLSGLIWYYRKPWLRYRGTRQQWRSVKPRQPVWSSIGVPYFSFLFCEV